MELSSLFRVRNASLSILETAKADLEVKNENKELSDEIEAIESAMRLIETL